MVRLSERHDSSWKFIEPANWKTSLLECFMHCLHTELISFTIQQPQNAFYILHIRMHLERFAVILVVCSQ